MRILVTGKNGQLGRSIYKIVNTTNDGNLPPNEFIFAEREELDLSNNKGEISWYDLTKEIFKLAKIDCKVSPITTKQYPTPARRPRNSTRQ
jgi:dTDP-4-dehydrorhamnose reductase